MNQTNHETDESARVTVAIGEGTSIAVEVNCYDESEEAQRIDLKAMSELCGTVCGHYVKHPDAQVGLSFINTAEMAELNEEYMDKNGPTDVLAFPIDGATETAQQIETETAQQIETEQPWIIGDIVICAEEAAKAKNALLDEIALLVVHGCLHLCGYDHYEPEEHEIMFKRQNELLEQLWKPTC